MQLERILKTKIANGEVSPAAIKTLELLSRIEYRPVQTSEDIETLYRFRYDCYYRSGYIKEEPSKLSFDDNDKDPYVMRFLMYLDGKLVSSIRLQHLTMEKRLGVSMVAFPELVGKMLERGETMIDPSRFTIDPVASKQFPQIPQLTVRLAAMAAVHFETDYCLNLIRPSHGAFYKRLIESKMIAEPTSYPGMAFPVCLYASHLPTSLERVFRRRPFFNSLPHEREMLFGTPATKSNEPKPLNVIPTAQFALVAA